MIYACKHCTTSNENENNMSKYSCWGFFFSYDEILRDVLDSQIIEGDIKNEETLHHTVISKHWIQQLFKDESFKVIWSVWPWLHLIASLSNRQVYQVYYGCCGCLKLEGFNLK